MLVNLPAFRRGSRDTSTVPIDPISIKISKQPVPITVAEGDSAEFEVVASSDEAINYQWTKDGVSIPQATAAVFKINSTKKSDEGIYQAILTSGNTSKKSDAVKLTVLTSDGENKEQETMKWAFQTGDSVRSSSPAIGSDGTIYVGSNDYNLYAIKPYE